jgi:hypothetical protein
MLNEQEAKKRKEKKMYHKLIPNGERILLQPTTTLIY